MAILASLMALALPSYRGYTSAWTCRSAAQILYADLVSQRQRCFTTCLSTGVNIHCNGTYSLWEMYNTGAYRPAPPGAELSEHTLPGFLEFLAMLIPAGCVPVNPVNSPTSMATVKTVSLSATFPMPVTLSPCTVRFIPIRSDPSGKWMHCHTLINNTDITANVDILLACGVETSVITITPQGDIIID
jgi:hypothetical protein